MKAYVHTFIHYVGGSTGQGRRDALRQEGMRLATTTSLVGRVAARERGRERERGGERGCGVVCFTFLILFI